MFSGPFYWKDLISAIIPARKHIHFSETWLKAERAGTAQPGQGTAQGDLIYVHKYPKEGCKKDWARLCSVMCRARTKGNKHKLSNSSFPLNTRKYFCDLQVMEHWHRLPGEVEVSSLEISRSCLDTFLLWMSLLEQLFRMDPELPASLEHSVVLWKDIRKVTLSVPMQWPCLDLMCGDSELALRFWSFFHCQQCYRVANEKPHFF